MYVYFIQGPPGTPVKIGKAQNPSARLASVQNGNPYRLHVRAVCKGGHPAERFFQNKFAANRLIGEWFDETETLLAVMAGLPSWDEVKAGAECPEIRNTDDLVLRDLWDQGYSFEDLASLLGVSRQRAHQIISPLLPPKRSTRRKRSVTPRPEKPIEQAFEALITNRSLR